MKRPQPFTTGLVPSPRRHGIIYRSRVLVWVLTLVALALQDRAFATSIGVGLDWRPKVFVQEYWNDGKVSYAIANHTDTDQVLTVSAWRDRKRLAGPWAVKAHAVIHVDASALIGLLVPNDLLSFALESGVSLGWMQSPKQPEGAPRTMIVTGYGLNGSGGGERDLWVEQDAVSFRPGSVVELRVRIPGSKGQLIIKQGDLLDLEVSCKTLTVNRENDQLVLDIAKPISAQDAHLVVLRFKAPNVEQTTMLPFSPWLSERGNRGGRGISRGVVIEPVASPK